MRDTGTGSDFTPAELDLLEDALESLGDPAHRANLDAMPAPLRERADQYAAILALTREAMPDEDVEPGLLDGILAEARRATPQPQVREAGPSWWDRLRKSFLLPGVALAGTAAVLLWVARPIDEHAPSLDEVREKAAPAPAAPEAKRDEPRKAEESKADLQDMAREPEAAPPPSPAAEAVELEKDDVPTDSAALPDPKPRATGGGVPAKTKKADKPLPELPGLDVPEAKRVDADKESIRDQLDSGDSERRRGHCDQAVADYTAVARSNGPASERARALAGLGLCREAEGKDADAERHFQQARALDPSIDAWLLGESERKQQVKKAAKSKNADGL